MKKHLRNDKDFFKAIAILVGTVVGAGIFGLPYAISKVGLVPGIIYILIIGLAVVGINIMYTEVVIRTRGKHRMSGYAKKYLGRPGQIIITSSLILGLYGGMLAYMIGIGNFAYGILGPMLGGSAMLYSLIFMVLIAPVVFRGVGVIASLELVLIEILIFVIVLVSGVALFKFQPVNFIYTNMAEFFYPFGIVLFAMGGATAIPTMRDILGSRRKQDLRRASIWGLVIPIIIYLIFTIAVIGVSGLDTSEQALIGLAPHLGDWVLIVGGLFGIIAMTTSFVAQSYVLRETYHQDYKIPSALSSFFVLLVPLLIFLLGIKSFVAVISISGALLSGFQGIIAILMYYYCKQKSKKLTFYRTNIPLFVGFLMFMLFLFGIAYQVYYFFIK